MNRRQGLRARPPVSALLGASLLMTVSASAFAVPISADLVITGSVGLRVDAGADQPFSDGNVTQNGSVRTISGGATTSAPFSTTPGSADGILGNADGVNDNTTVLPSPNPLTAGLTDTGDGIGWSTDLDALFETGDNINFTPGYDFVVDFGIDLANLSATDTYTVTLQVDFSHAVDADDVDAFADASLDVERDGVDVLLSDVTSDSFLGDELNGNLLGTFGAPVIDAGVLLFDVILAPGATGLFGGDHRWEGAVFFDNAVEPGASFVNISTDITILDVVCTGVCAPPQQAPAPGTLAMLGLAVPALAMVARRRRRKAAA